MSNASSGPSPERWRAAIALSAAVRGYIEEYRSEHPDVTLGDVRDALKDVYTQYMAEALWGKPQ